MKRVISRRWLANAAVASLTAGGMMTGVLSSASAAAIKVSTMSDKDARKTAEATITQDALKTYLSFIASDELEGRYTPSRGLDTAALFIATNLSRWGFTPMGDNGTFFQKITLRNTVLDGPKSVVTVAGNTLRYGADFLPGSGGDSPAATTPVPLVYVGHGWLVKSKGIDAYKGVDVRGKIVVLGPRSFTAPGLKRGDLARDAQGTDWLSPDAYAKQSGAVGIIRLSASEDTATWDKNREGISDTRALGTEIVGLEDEDRPSSGSLPSITLSPDAAKALFSGEKLSAEAATKDASTNAQTEPFVFGANKTATISVVMRTETATTQNVVAVWEGSDAKLKNEYVALGAHYDHIGINDQPSATGDRINNGADDDGSGTTALITFAEALSHTPEKRPKRSLLFVWHCGEERGLWGSSYFTAKPTVPLKSIVTQLNIDMIGRSKKDPNDTNPRNSTLSDPKTIYVIGSRMLSTQLGDTVAVVNKNYANLNLDYRYDDPKDPNGFYYRSDHYNYAKRGIPIAFFFDGVHEDYHRVSDEVSKIDFPKYETVARTIFLTAVAVADLDRAPVVDKK